MYPGIGVLSILGRGGFVLMDCGLSLLDTVDLCAPVNFAASDKLSARNTLPSWSVIRIGIAGVPPIKILPGPIARSYLNLRVINYVRGCYIVAG